MTKSAELGIAPPRRLRGPDRNTLFAWLFVALVVVAWSALWALHASPFARYVDHGGWGDAGALAALCTTIPQGQIIVPAVLDAEAKERFPDGKAQLPYMPVVPQPKS